MYMIAGGRQTGKTTRILSWLKEQMEDRTFICYVLYGSGSVPSTEELLKKNFPNTPTTVKMSRISFCLPDNSEGNGILVVENIDVRNEEHLKRTVKLLKSIEEGTTLNVAATFLISDPHLLRSREDIQWLSTPSSLPNGVKSETSE